MMTALEVITNEVAACTKCSELVFNRLNTVPGEGNLKARLMVFGESPGQTEAELGRPFVGESGKLLDNIFKACGWQREKLFITNIVKCRPPNNRVPYVTEQENCRSFLDRQIEEIDPKFLLLLGATATEAIFGLPFGMVRGDIHDLNGKFVLPTYHPSYLLRNPEAKSIVWEHLQKLVVLIDKDGGL